MKQSRSLGVALLAIAAVLGCGSSDNAGTFDGSGGSGVGNASGSGGSAMTTASGGNSSGGGGQTQTGASGSGGVGQTSAGGSGGVGQTAAGGSGGVGQTSAGGSGGGGGILTDAGLGSGGTSSRDAALNDTGGSAGRDAAINDGAPADVTTTNGCGPDGAACALAAANGFCKAGLCTACVDTVDDAACNAAYGASGAPYICKSGTCVSGCRTGAACATGFCVDQVCCDTDPASCTGCRACNVSGSVGVCTNVHPGDDPHDACTASAASCTGDACNGSGSCAVADSTPCASSTCSNGAQTNYSCQSGACTPAPQSCGSFGCSNGHCVAACTVGTNVGCPSGSYCSGGTSCVPKVGNSVGCTADSQCQGGNCVDGVCCDTPASSCSGCQACNVAGSVGKCSNVPPGQDVHDTCTLNVATCKQANCDGNGACAATDGTNCGASTCGGATETDHLCEAGVCTSPSKSCSGGFACSGTTCGISCTVGTNAGCKAGLLCIAGTSCGSKLGSGATCSADAMCALGHCVDGVCCDTGSCSGCQACNVKNLEGKCSNVPPGQDPHGACTLDVANCALAACAGDGTCRAADGTACGASSCVTGTEIDSICLDGSCTPSGTACAPFDCVGTACATSCVAGSNVGCPSGNYCVGGTSCAPKIAQGQTCSADGQCATGNCVDGYCCDHTSATCSGCMACNQSPPGVCKAVAAGTDPHDVCNAGACTSNMCNAAGTCALANGTSCGAASCAGTTETDSSCQSGSCQTTPKSCGTLGCNGGVCATTCDVATNAGCPTNTYCVGSTKCVSKLAQGTTCTQDTQCSTGNCVDGYCCNKPVSQCSGCLACNGQGGPAGTCKNVIAGTDLHNACAANVAACSQANCNGNGSCSVADGIACGAPTCSGPDESDQKCAGGACTPTPKTCGAFACVGTQCATSCTVGTNVGCPSGSYCASPTSCVATLDLGSKCTAGNQCDSGNCVDKTCCSSTACGTCQACNLGGGVCTDVAIHADPHADCAPNSATCTAGGCDGSGACIPSPAGHFCGTATCTSTGCSGQCNGTTTTSNTCDGITVGSCPTTTPTGSSGACQNNLGCASSTTCLSSCGDNADCDTGYYCQGGACVQQILNGQDCASPKECLSGICNTLASPAVCSSCGSKFDCGPTAPLCDAYPVGCTGPCGGNADCTVAGLGSICQNPHVVGLGLCMCGGPGECNARGASCIANECGCSASGKMCGPGRYCTDASGSGTCKWAPGEPCVLPGDCSSGTCTAGVCGQLASTKPCNQNTDCLSGSCVSYACL